jgi:hypothetical protein
LNAKQIVGLIGAIIVIAGCFLPIANVPIVGGINYMFPPGGKMGDGVIVAGLAVLGLLGAIRGGSLLLLLASVGGALIFGNTMSNLHGVLKEASETGGLAGAMMSTVGIGPGAAAISVGLLLMFVSAAMPGAKAAPQSPELVPCPSCAEKIQPLAKKCRFCGAEISSGESPGAA